MEKPLTANEISVAALLRAQGETLKHMEESNERLAAEIERLTAALQRIAGGGEIYDSPSHLMGIARRALEGK